MGPSGITKAVSAATIGFNKGKISKKLCPVKNFSIKMVFQTQNSCKKIIYNTKVLLLMYIIYTFYHIKFHVKHFCVDATTIKKRAHRPFSIKNLESFKHIIPKTKIGVEDRISASGACPLRYASKTLKFTCPLTPINPTPPPDLCSFTAA